LYRASDKNFAWGDEKSFGPLEENFSLKNALQPKQDERHIVREYEALN